MKIQIVSDLHLEFLPVHLIYQLTECDSDVLVIAGDLHTSRGIIRALEEVFRYVNKHIVLVPGNHEYYYSTKQHVDEVLQEHFADHEYIHVLNNSIWEHKNTIFLGSTGWWTANAAKDVVHLMNDYNYIYDLVPANCGLDWGWESHNFFVENLKKYDKRNIFGKNITNKTVVCVTHNAPSLHSIDKEFEGDELNPCFANAWADLMMDYKPDFWIHGHIHSSKEYKIDETLVICNPYGYSGCSLNAKFNPCKIIET